MKKTFDAVAWMRKQRMEIDEEDKGLSWEEKREKTRKLLEKDPLWLRLKDRLMEPTQFPSNMSTKKGPNVNPRRLT